MTGGVREARPDDVDRLRDLQTLLSEPSPDLLDVALAGAGTVLVSVDAADDPVGYLIAFLGPDAYVAEVVVAPGRRREGRATALLESACDRARDGGCGTVRVALRPDDVTARRCYESCGFVAEGRAPGYYASGDGEALLMRRRP